MSVRREAQALVIDLMASDPIVVAPDLPVDQVARVLADYDIGGLPVVDASGRLVGVVSQSDLLRLRTSSSASVDWPRLFARDVMTQPAMTIRSSASLEEAAQRMAEHHVHRLVVVGDDTEIALGVISDSDLIRAFAY